MQAFTVADHRLLKIHGHWFLYAPDQGTVFEVEAEVAEALGLCHGAGVFTRAKVMDRLSTDDSENTDVFQDLLDRGIVLPVASESVQPRIDERTEKNGVAPLQAQIPLQTLILHVTEDCNLSCLYCYRSKSQRNESAMTLSTALAGVDFLLERSGPLKEIVLVFFGGEPFLNYDLMAQTAEYARAKSTAMGKTVSLAVTTNGTLLTPEVIRFISEYQVGVTVSIDGYAAIQDRYRPFPSGAPSYAAILPKLRSLLQQGGRKPVVARVTVAGDAGSVPQVLDHLLGLGFSEVGFSPVTTADPRYQLDHESMEALLEQFKVLSETFLEHAKHDRFLGFSNLIDLLVTLHEGQVKDYPCGAGLGLFSMDAAGRLYLCQRLTGEDAGCMGDVFKGFDARQLARFREEAAARRRHECRGCWARRICAGGCYHEALTRQGELTQPNRHYCRWIQRWITIGLEVYCRLALERPEYLDKLSLLRGHKPLFQAIV